MIGISQNDVLNILQGTSGTVRTATASLRTQQEMASPLFRSEVTSAKVPLRNTGSELEFYFLDEQI